MSTNKSSKGIPVSSKIPTSGRDSGTHSRSSSVSNLTSVSDIHSDAGDVSESTHNFKVNDRVWVNGTKPGYIKFLGKTQFAPGVWAGVLLDEPVGKNDGSVSGVKYFSCEPLKGIFARPQKLSKSYGAISGVGDTSVTSSPKGSTNSINITTPPNRSLPSASVLSSGSRVCSRLRLGERVVVSSTTGIKTGILRFLGETDFAKGEWAGIELDEPVGKNDGSVAGKRYFSCAMRYGLFSPLHKVSRAGGTATPRSGRATPLMRSTSRDSLSSSVSNSSKASRVKLGVTSLTNTQPKSRTTGMGIMTTSRALEETLKEKEQHIEQLLKEHDLEKIELARVTGHCKEIEAKYLELQKYQQAFEGERKSLQEQLCTDKRKLEDLQFQLEEEKITKCDLEMNFELQKRIMKRIEEFIEAKSDGKFVNIKEILEGKEQLSEIPEKEETNFQAGQLNEKIATLEANLKSTVEEKKQHIEELENLRQQLSDREKNSENLKVTLQEKDDVVSNLKNELNTQLEKVTKFAEENETLKIQINSSAAETKEHTDKVVKDLGEKNKLLSEELNSKNSLLQEYESSLQENNNKISLLNENSEIKAQQLAEMQKQNQTLQQNLEEKITELSEKLALQKSLEEKVATLKAQVETEIPKHEEKMLRQVYEIETLKSSLLERENELAQKQTEISTLNEKIIKLDEEASQFRVKLQETENNSFAVNKSNTEKITSLEEEIEKLKKEKSNMTSKFGKELEVKEADFKVLSEELETQKTHLTEKEIHISQLTQTLTEKESEYLKLQEELAEAKKGCVILKEEKERNVDALNTKEKLISDLEKELQALKKSEVEKNSEIEKIKQCADDVKNSLKQKEDENVLLISQLQLAEQKVEMLNKDSSEHVMALQDELSKLKDENIKTKTSLEQELAQLQNLNENMTKAINEKDTILKEKDEVISDLQGQITLKENDMLNLSTEGEKLGNEISSLHNDKKEMSDKYEKKLSLLTEEFNAELKKKEKQLEEMQEENKKLSDAINEKINAFGEKDEALAVLQNQLKAKEDDAGKLSKQVEQLNQELASLSKTKEEMQLDLDKQLQIARELTSKLDEKEKIIKQSQSDNSEFNTLLEAKDQELLQKESLISSLTAAVKAKEFQFDELSQMIEDSQTQLKKLSEQNESNLKLLENKESFINDFKAETEKQLFEVQENAKQNNARFEEAVKKQEDDIKAKDDIILKLNTEAEGHAKLIETLNEELKKTKALSETTLQSNDEIHKDFISKIADLEAKYSKLVEEKKKIEDAEYKARGEKENLEVARDSLLKEKVHQEKVVKDKEARLEALQAEVNRMQADFTQHKQDLERKLDISEMEKQAALELKNELELQHKVLEELQQDLQNSEEKNKTLETQLMGMSDLTTKKTELMNKLSELEKTNKEKSEKILQIEEKYQALEELLGNRQNSLRAKEVECASLNEKVKSLQSDKESKETLKSSLKSLEQENMILKLRIEKMEKSVPEKNSNKPGEANASQMDSEERESLISQVDFLNSIIVDMKQKNEHLQQEIEVLKMGPLEIESNLNEVKKIAPRLFCDICDMFDLHDTDDCPKQASYIEDEPVPHMLPPGTRKLEERPYCNNCEIFGHWTLDCEEQETY